MEWNYLNHSVYIRTEEGRILAEVLFPEREPGIFEIQSIYLAEEYIGSSLQEEIMEAALKQIRSQGGKAEAVDPYAKRYFSEHHL